jgi:hypothetical protein
MKQSIIVSSPTVLPPAGTRDPRRGVPRRPMHFLHSHANTIEVEMEYANRYLRIVVRDDGCGIDPQVLDAARLGHWGLSKVT